MNAFDEFWNNEKKENTYLYRTYYRSHVREGFKVALEWMLKKIENYYWSYDTDTEGDAAIQHITRELLVDLCEELKTDQYTEGED